MTRHIVTVLFLIGILLGTAGRSAVYAVEGRIEIRNGNAACVGISYYNGSQYRVIGRCQGLVYPYSEKLTNYYLWATPAGGGPPVRLQEVDEGLFDAQTETDAASVFLTAETESSPMTPGVQIMGGTIDPFNLSNGSTTMNTSPIATPLITGVTTASPTPVSAMTVRPFSWPFGWMGTGAFGIIVLLLLGLLLFSTRR